VTRVPHRIRHNARSTVLNHLVTVDTEAVQTKRGDLVETHTLRLAVAEYWSPARRRQKERLVYEDFVDAVDFWRWVLEQLPARSAATVIAHNAAYDMRLLDMFRLLPYLGFELDRLVMDDPPFIAHWVESCAACAAVPDGDGVAGEPRRRKGCTASRHRSLRVWSTTNLAPLPLSLLAATIAREKLPMPKPKARSSEWVAYCRRDVEILGTWYRSYVKWLSDNDMGTLSPTIGAQSWHAFTHRYMREPILVHGNSDVLHLERSSYFGGRCECFRLGDLSGEGWSHLDVNALYPFVMSRTYVPTSLVTTRKRPPVELLGRLVDRYCLVAKVTLATQIAIFPTRYRGSLCFPVGRFETYLTTPELSYALKHGMVESCSYAAVYDRALLFADFVADLWRLRRVAADRGDLVGDLIAKLMANSLTGKFGQRAQRWLPIGTTDPNDAGVLDEWDCVQERWRTVRWIGGRVYEKQPPEEGAESFPAISAHITAAGRMHLAGLLDRIERFDCAYVDTDSLIVNADGRAALADLIAPAELGGLKVKREDDHLVVRGPKWYEHGPDVVRKGVKPDAEWRSQDGVTQWHWRGLSWSIDHNAVDRVQLERVQKDFRFTYGKGTVVDDGRVFPLVLA
jgi:hypothetical protein